MAGNKAELTWFYYPLKQNSAPTCFKIYYDNGTGQINYESPLSEINYLGRLFYSYQSDSLEVGKYLFAVRAVDSDGTENDSLSQLKIHIDTAGPDEIDVMSAEAV